MRTILTTVFCCFLFIYNSPHSIAQTLPGADTRTKNVTRDFPQFITTKVNSISESTTREGLTKLGFRRTPQNEYPLQLKKSQELMSLSLYSSDLQQYVTAFVVFNLGVLHRVEIHAGTADKDLHHNLKELSIESHLDRLAKAYAGPTYIKRNESQTEMISRLFEKPYNEIKEDLFDFSHRVDGYYFISMQHRLKAFVK
ncbi:hypothetical protein [Kiloniella sp.]|uniref:hypothetical protein n=1 Tax=Kiloniella sp. TaxID=1938587 RepID=UPI003A8FCFD5